jgi:hypothetical protein
MAGIPFGAERRFLFQAQLQDNPLTRQLIFSRNTFRSPAWALSCTGADDAPQENRRRSRPGPEGFLHFDARQFSASPV